MGFGSGIGMGFVGRSVEHVAELGTERRAETTSSSGLKMAHGAVVEAWLLWKMNIETFLP